jgi:hypothetical protein
VLEFKAVAGFPAPSQPSVTIIGGKLTTIIFDYGQILTAQDLWRLTHFDTTESTGNAADNSDPDGDGSVNRSEYAAGTDPNDASDVLRILTTEKTSEGFTVTVDCKKGRSYALQRAESLAAGVWNNVVSIGPLPADQSSVPLTHPNPPSSFGFYRIEVSAP